MRKNKIITPIPEPEIKIEDILLKGRRLFLYGEVTPESMEKLVKSIFVLNALKTEPIFLYINSPGGTVCDGFSLINIIKFSKSPISTIVNGEACSMTGLISIVGKQRFMTTNSFWMAHDLFGGKADYSGKIEYRAAYLKKLWQIIYNHLKIYTKLSDKEIELARNGELWLNAEECLSRNIIDKIL